MSGDASANEPFSSIEPGSVVYDEDNDLVGIVREFTDDGVEVVPPEASESAQAEAEENAPASEPADGSTPDREEQPGQKFGEGYIMWKCGECGEMGELEGGMPEECPNCGAEKESLYRFRED